jgi:hypothetical protein
MSNIASICNIQDLLDRWRTLGSLKLRNGVELLAKIPDSESSSWMHAVFPGMSAAVLKKVVTTIEGEMPASLRAFYRGCGGMSLFGDLFTVYGAPRTHFVIGDDAFAAADIIEFNRHTAALPWAVPHMVAFASSAWDGSIYVAGLGATPDEVVRCERKTGQVLQRHTNVFTCIEARLYHLDGALELLPETQS